MGLVATGRGHAVKIQGFALGAYQTNCYVISGEDRAGKPTCWVADCGFEPGSLLHDVDEIGVEPEAFVLTHAHVDHIAGLREARRRHPDAPIWVHEAERDWLTDANKNLSAMSPVHVTAPPADRLLRDGETLTLGGERWRVMHTPGHSPGSISLVHDETGTCLCGDAIFNRSIGRTDFPGCSFDVLADSIRSKLYTLPDDTLLLPGHGPSTTVGEEKRHNPFVPAVVAG